MNDTEAKTKWKCPACLGELQLTRKQYYSVFIDADGAVVEQVQTEQPDMWQLYCENDHELSEFEAFEHEIAASVSRTVEEINKSQADPSWGEGKNDF